MPTVPMSTDDHKVPIPFFGRLVDSHIQHGAGHQLFILKSVEGESACELQCQIILNRNFLVNGEKHPKLRRLFVKVVRVLAPSTVDPRVNKPGVKFWVTAVISGNTIMESDD
jgi:hypothetical protein